jgi:hypothetical protein
MWSKQNMNEERPESPDQKVHEPQEDSSPVSEAEANERDPGFDARAEEEMMRRLRDLGYVE